MADARLLLDDFEEPEQNHTFNTLLQHMSAAGISMGMGPTAAAAAGAGGGSDSPAAAAAGRAGDGGMFTGDATKLQEMLELAQEDVQRLVQLWKQQNLSKLQAAAPDIWLR